MTVLLPYTRLHPATARLANRHAPGHRKVPLWPGDDASYWRLLADEWRKPGDLTVIEHDIGIHAGVVEGFTTCPQPWCGHPYLIGRTPMVCLGCTRFTAALKSAEPDLLDVVGRIGEPGLPPGSWRRLDVRIAGELTRRGYTVHEHTPQVAHYHHYPA